MHEDILDMAPASRRGDDMTRFAAEWESQERAPLWRFPELTSCSVAELSCSR